MSSLENFNGNNVKKINDKKGNKIVDFKPGDLVKVSYRITEGDTTRIQVFEGTVIAKNRGKDNLSFSFVVRKISHGIGVERKFLVHSPLVEEISVAKQGVTRRAKLYFLRDRSGKSARIKEKIEAVKKDNE